MRLLCASTFSLMTGYFLPEMGIDPQLRLPLFVGVLIIVFVTQGGVSGLILALDLEREKH